jgi:hypothetical protein
MHPIQSVHPRPRSLATLGSFIFLSRWLQAPLYIGLIIAQGVYVYHFLKELWHLVQKTPTLDETAIMLTVLGLIDVVMIANLLIMVIVGGYDTFVSRLNLQGLRTSRSGSPTSMPGCSKSNWPPPSSAHPPFICSKPSLKWAVNRYRTTP